MATSPEALGSVDLHLAILVALEVVVVDQLCRREAVMEFHEVEVSGLRARRVPFIGLTLSPFSRRQSCSPDAASTAVVMASTATFPSGILLYWKPVE